LADLDQPTAPHASAPEAPRLKIRGYVALTVICLGLLLADVVQRLVIQPAIWLAPSRRVAILARWERLMAWWVLTNLSFLGGARVPELPAIPGGPGVLILMNHQSVVDIPLVVASLRGSYPRIVTRKRYERWIPLISHMVRLYQYPVVDPRAKGADMRRSLATIRDAARTSDVPLAIFPEGTRTRDGEIGRFRTTGLKLILRQRSWDVYVMVADGFWQRAKVKDFVGGMAAIEGKVALRGPFRWDQEEGDPDGFIQEMRTVMEEELNGLRQATTA
jgi:1-acyl-sn-glycerol-3-phosphate acyltransferase